MEKTILFIAYSVVLITLLFLFAQLFSRLIQFVKSVMKLQPTFDHLQMLQNRLQTFQEEREKKKKEQSEKKKTFFKIGLPLLLAIRTRYKKEDDLHDLKAYQRYKKENHHKRRLTSFFKL